MENRLIRLILLILAITLLGACSDKEKSVSTDNENLIIAEADKLVKEKVITTYKQMGIEIEQYEINRTKLVKQVPYSEGGTFDFYEVEVRIKPKKPEQVDQIEKMDGIKFKKDKEGWIVENPNIGKIFISAYNDGNELYEFLWHRDIELPRTEKDELDFNAFVTNRYEEIRPDKIEEEYTFKFGDTKMSLGENFKGEIPLEKAEVIRKDTKQLMNTVASYKETWKNKEICAETYSYFEKHYEPILRMVTSDATVETNRGIKVGSLEDELFETYGIENLVFSSSSFGGEPFDSFAVQQKVIKENEEWTCFGFTGEDATQNYIAFYMKQGKVFAIEMGNGFDYKPFEKQAIKFPLEVEDFINDHIDEPNVMKYDVVIPKIKESVNGSENLNALIQLDFQQIIDFSQKGQYEIPTTGFVYPWVDINYTISDLGDVSALNVFITYSSALGSGADKFVKSYYYDTSCGARLSEEAALYKLGYRKEVLNKYLEYQYPGILEEEEGKEAVVKNILFYLHETGEPRFIVATLEN